MSKLDSVVPVVDNLSTIADNLYLLVHSQEYLASAAKYAFRAFRSEQNRCSGKDDSYRARELFDAAERLSYRFYEAVKGVDEELMTEMGLSMFSYAEDGIDKPLPDKK